MQSDGDSHDAQDPRSRRDFLKFMAWAGAGTLVAFIR